MGFLVVALIEWQYEVGRVGEEQVTVTAAIARPPKTAANHHVCLLSLVLRPAMHSLTTSLFMPGWQQTLCQP